MTPTCFLLFLFGIPIFSASAQTRGAHPTTTGSPTDTVFFASQVSLGGDLLPHHPVPQYPAALRPEKIAGTVIAEWVIDTTGSPEMATFRILKSPRQEFSDAVRLAVAGMRYTPAIHNGRKVRELIQTRFEFQFKHR